MNKKEYNKAKFEYKTKKLAHDTSRLNYDKQKLDFDNKKLSYNKRKLASDNRELRKKEFSNNLNFISLIIGVILILLFVRIIINFDSPDFVLPTIEDIVSLINNSYVIEIPNLNINNNLTSIPILGDFLNAFGSIANVVIFLANGVVSIVLFAWNVIKWLFLLG